MAKQITEYELLISCPSDVTEELAIITETVETFNQIFGPVNNSKIVTKHWSKNSFPQSGGKPQKLLNDQFVLACDAAIAVFWTRFGTPTDDYGSGTEEEIEELIKSGRQVFLYFSDRPAKPSQIDSKQYEKIQAFRTKYEGRGIYWQYSTLDTFKKDILNHLTLYFIKLFNSEKMQSKKTCRSNLSLKGINDGKLTDTIVPFFTQYSNLQYLIDLKENILSHIEQIQTLQLPDAISIKSKKYISDETVRPSNEKLTSDLSKLLSKVIVPVNPLVINQSSIQKINKFADDNNIELNNSFYYLGNLSTRLILSVGIMGPSYSNSPSGTKEEELKYNLINKLEILIDEYSQSIDYFSAIDRKAFVNLALCNFGTDYDEDIDVKLFIKKGCLCHPKNLPFPGDECLDIANKLFKYIYKPEQNVVIDLYPDYSLEMNFPPFTLSLTHKDELNNKKGEFTSKRDRLFCYEFFTQNDHDIICYNQNYLKQNTNSFLPSYLVFNKLPDKIRFEITSKRFPQVINGELLIDIIKNDIKQCSSQSTPNKTTKNK